MPVYTPRGLKIWLSVEHTFALLARLYPSVSPFAVLKTTEGIATIPLLLATCVALIAFIANLHYLLVGFSIIIASSVGTFIANKVPFAIPGLVPAATALSYVSGFGLILVPVCVLGYIKCGMIGVVVYLIGSFVSFLLSQVMENRFASFAKAATGLTLTAHEVFFFQAYKRHAGRIGADTNVNVTDEELEESNWMPVLCDLALQWPHLVQRFS